MKITDALLGEHGVFYAQFEHLEQLLAVPVAAERVHDLAALLAAGLGPHAELEDELLFDQVDADGHLGAMAVMRDEHRAIEDALGRAQTERDAAAASELLLHAIHEARDHFAREERIAFPLAAARLGEQRLRELGAAWSARRAVTLV